MCKTRPKQMVTTPTFQADPVIENGERRSVCLTLAATGVKSPPQPDLCVRRCQVLRLPQLPVRLLCRLDEGQVAIAMAGVVLRLTRLGLLRHLHTQGTESTHTGHGVNSHRARSQLTHDTESPHTGHGVTSHRAWSQLTHDTESTPQGMESTHTGHGVNSHMTRSQLHRAWSQLTLGMESTHT